jgi:predicted GNAT family acetyltransferase
MNIEHHANQNRFVLLEGDTFLGEVEYDQRGNNLLLVRAEVPVELRGKGLGAELVKGTLEAIQEIGGLTVTPICPYIAKYMMKNKQFQGLRS